MKLAMIGLGKMGANMCRRLVGDGHELEVHDLDTKAASALAAESELIQAASDMTELLARLPLPRVVWIMVPHQYVDQTIDELLQAGLTAGDLIVDGGNSNYKLSQQRAARLLESNIHFVDSGTSGGVWGLANGYSLMVGGTEEAISLLRPVLESLAPASDQGWGHVGPAGAGHYVKMVHNGIEYGMMQAFAEGFELLDAKADMSLDMGQISKIWQHGSVVRSWLLDLIAEAFDQDQDLSSFSDYVDDSGEGRWTVQDSIDLAVPTPVLTLALQMRFRSRQELTYSGRVLNAMRAGFGGHTIKPVN